MNDYSFCYQKSFVFVPFLFDVAAVLLLNFIWKQKGTSVHSTAVIEYIST